MTASATYRFAGFELRPRERTLLQDGKPATVGPRAFDLLVTLIERAGELVTKDELLERVWPQLVVEENNVQVQVSALRKVLGQDAIATVAGRGYRFTHAVTRLPDGNALFDAAAGIYCFLSEAERSLLRRLSVFAGGFEIDAAEAVGAGNDVATADVLYLLAELVDKALVVFEPQLNRYRMREPVRRFALERLVEASEATDARDAHLRFHVDLARSAQAAMRTDRQAQLMARIPMERENFVIAIAHARDQRQRAALEEAIASLATLPEGSTST